MVEVGPAGWPAGDLEYRYGGARRQPLALLQRSMSAAAEKKLIAGETQNWPAPAAWTRRRRRCAKKNQRRSAGL